MARGQKRKTPEPAEEAVEIDQKTIEHRQYKISMLNDIDYILNNALPDHLGIIRINVKYLDPRGDQLDDDHSVGEDGNKCEDLMVLNVLPTAKPVKIAKRIVRKLHEVSFPVDCRSVKVLCFRYVVKDDPTVTVTRASYINCEDELIPMCECDENDASLFQ